MCMRHTKVLSFVAFIFKSTQSSILTFYFFFNTTFISKQKQKERVGVKNIIKLLFINVT